METAGAFSRSAGSAQALNLADVMPGMNPVELPPLIGLERSENKVAGDWKA
jgi:hypothetical protein